jgi:hypothetical protein
VPAFLGTAVAVLSDRAHYLGDEDIRCALTRVLEVCLAPTDPNPWDLPVSSNESDWGVTQRVAVERFPSIIELLDGRQDLILKAISIYDFLFHKSEAWLPKIINQNTIVGIAFDYSLVVKPVPGTAVSAGSWAYHIARLTPIGTEKALQHNIAFERFAPGYSGDLEIFDDSGEIVPRRSVVSWPTLINACRYVNGSLWIVGSGDIDLSEPGAAVQVSFSDLKWRRSETCQEGPHTKSRRT